MPYDPFVDEDSSVLSREAFEFVLTHELKRAVRSQNFLTLLVIAALPRTPTGERPDVGRQMARLVSREIRETDLLTVTEDGRLSVVLLDADLQNSMRVIDRLLSRVEHYEFSPPATVAIGAASCPTHGTDAETLRRAASAWLVQSGRESRGNAWNAQ